MKRQYTLSIELNTNPAYYNYTVIVSDGHEEREFSGNKLHLLLKQASKHIIEEFDE